MKLGLKAPIVVLGLVAALAGSPAETARAANCPVSPPGNGTGYHPPSNARSLSKAPYRPGPSILYEPLATSPQLENTGPWRASPIMISGSRAYRDGELLYQDWLYDDRALTYPDEPQRYAGNAADIVEVRIKPLARATAVRITYNTMLDPGAAATTISLGDSPSPRAMPHGAGASTRAQVFVTAHGCSGDAVRADDGSRIPGRVSVVTDLQRRQVEIRVPYRIFDPRGRTVRVGAAAGLWDAGKGAYLRPDSAKPAFFNVAFREYGPWTQNTWMDASQNAALASGDLSPLHADVDFRKLAKKVNDDLVGRPGGVPQAGPMNRILVSRFEPMQGRGNDTAGGGIIGNYACEPPDCTYQYSGRLQPYSVYVPKQPAPRSGYGLTLNLHGAGSNHNHFETHDDVAEWQGLTPLTSGLSTWRMLAQRGHPSIMVMPNARGASYFYYGLAGADAFEAIADAAGHYHLDPRHFVLTGSSMGGYGTYKLGSQFPDLWRGILPNIAPEVPYAGVPLPPPLLAGPEAELWRLYASLRHVPVLATAGQHDPVVTPVGVARSMATLDGLGYRYDYWFFNSTLGHVEHRDFVPDQYEELVAGRPDQVPDPRHVTYVFNGSMSDARYGLASDHAYWLSGLRLSNPAASPPLGTVDAVSQAIPGGEPTLLPSEQSAGTSTHGSPAFVRNVRRWGDVVPGPTAPAYTVTTTNLAALTLDVRRMKLPEFETFMGTVTTDSPLTLRLTGAFGDATTATVNGKPANVVTDGTSATLDLPAGSAQTVRISQPRPARR